MWCAKAVSKVNNARRTSNLWRIKGVGGSVDVRDRRVNSCARGTITLILLNLSPPLVSFFSSHYRCEIFRIHGLTIPLSSGQVNECAPRSIFALREISINIENSLKKNWLTVLNFYSIRIHNMPTIHNTAHNSVTQSVTWPF